MKPLIGHFKLQQLTKAVYQKHYINELEKSYKPSTVRLLHNSFKIAINAAVKKKFYFGIALPKLHLMKQLTFQIKPMKII